MENARNAFTVEEVFLITNRGLVVIGEVSGVVSAGKQLLFENGFCWAIKSVEGVYKRGQPSKIGLLMDSSSVSLQELRSSITGAIAQLI